MDDLKKSDLEDMISDIEDVCNDPELSDAEKVDQIQDIVSPESGDGDDED